MQRVATETIVSSSSGREETPVSVRLNLSCSPGAACGGAGDFNQWKTDVHEMNKSDGIWSIDLKLKPGVYSYSFVIDGKSWSPIPSGIL